MKIPFADMEKVYLDCTTGDRHPPLMMYITQDPTYIVGGYDQVLPGWWREIRRSSDDAVLQRWSRGRLVYDAAEACP